MIRLLTVACLATLALASCGANRGPYGSTGEQRRDIAKAARLYQEAVAEIADHDLVKAERLLRQSLAADLFHGPAHNNLGVILLGQEHLYDAAEEFEWARKLLPGHPEPRVNLAIALERGGRHADALEAAQSALEVRPGHLGAIKVVATIAVNEGHADQTTVQQLDAIVARSDEPEWRDWAREERLRLISRLQP
jgi:tetratricopeptide (TPR) repeat protein